MFRKSICVILIAGLLFQIGCATTKTVPVLRKEYDKLKEEKTIFVTVKSRQEYELIEFEITDTHIIGTSIIRKPYTNRIVKEKIEIKLEDVEFIQIRKIDTRKLALSAGCILGFTTFWFLFFFELVFWPFWPMD